MICVYLATKTEGDKTSVIIDHDKMCMVKMSRLGPPDYIIVWWRFP